MENPEALGFHQETMKESTQQMETMKNSTEIPGLVLYQTLHYFFTRTLFLNRENYYKFQLQIQNPRRYL